MRSLSEFRSTSTAELPPARLGLGVGAMSLGLAAAQLAAPRALLRLIGVTPTRAAAAVVRLLGITKLGLGIAVLLGPRRARPLTLRAAQDALDLGLVGLAGRRTSTLRRIASAAAVAGVGAVNTVAARRAQKAFAAENRIFMYSVTINRPPEEVYAFFRKLERLPAVMDYLEAVREIDDVRSQWVARLPTGRSVEWEARITEDTPGEAIAWQSVEGARIQNSGRVTFARTPGRDMTEVRVEMKLGAAGHESTLLAKLLAKPEIKGDLRRLKQVLETGEVLVSDASAHVGKHPAQPDPDVDRRPHVFFPNPPTAVKGVTP